jgi:hypothetical protein
VFDAPVEESPEEEEEEITTLKRTINIRHNKDVKASVIAVGKSSKSLLKKPDSMESIDKNGKYGNDGKDGKDGNNNRNKSSSDLNNNTCRNNDLIKAVRSASTNNTLPSTKFSDSESGSGSLKADRRSTDQKVIDVFRSFRFVRFII